MSNIVLWKCLVHLSCFACYRDADITDTGHNMSLFDQSKEQFQHFVLMYLFTVKIHYIIMWNNLPPTFTQPKQLFSVIKGFLENLF